MPSTFIEIFQLSNILLFILLIIILIISFKVLKVFFQTLFVMIFSAIFYIFLSYSGANLEVNTSNVLFFSLAGAVLYIVYSLIWPFLTLAYKAVYKIVKSSSKAFKRSEKKKIKEKDVILKEIKNE